MKETKIENAAVQSKPGAIKETREFRSNSFSLLLKQQKYALEVYNCLNGSDYKNPEDVEVLDVDGGVSLTVRHDAAFIIDSNLSIYEHQSTINPNMPLRILIYVSKLFKSIARSGDIFDEKLLKLPFPRFVVFYNGDDKWGEDFELKLSDAYKHKGEAPWLELRCRVININPGHNEELVGGCGALNGYMTYVSKVKEYRKDIGVEAAVNKAVDECIKENVLGGFFKMYKDLIINDDLIDGTYETRLARKEWYVRRDIAENMLRAKKDYKEISEMTRLSIEEIKNIESEMFINV